MPFRALRAGARAEGEGRVAPAFALSEARLEAAALLVFLALLAGVALAPVTVVIMLVLLVLLAALLPLLSLLVLLTLLTLLVLLTALLVLLVALLAQAALLGLALGHDDPFRSVDSFAALFPRRPFPTGESHGGGAPSARSDMSQGLSLGHVLLAAQPWPALGSDCQRPKSFPCVSLQVANQPIPGTGMPSLDSPPRSRTRAAAAPMSSTSK